MSAKTSRPVSRSLSTADVSVTREDSAEDRGTSALLDKLPFDWDFATLGEINTHKAPTVNPKNFPDETFEYYSIPDFQRDERPSLTKGDEIKSSKLLLEPKTVLFGKLNPRVEKVWRVDDESEFRKIGSTEWITILPGADVDWDFLYFLVWSPHVMPLAKSLVSGSTPSRQRVDPKSFYRLNVPLPPLPEQKKIAHILSKVQQTIYAQERIIQTTTELKKALMHKLFTEGFRNEPQIQTRIGLVPESWEVAKVGDYAKIQSGGTPSRDVPENWTGGTIPWVKTGEIDYCIIRDTEEKITSVGLRDSAARLYPAGTLLMAMYGQGVTRGKVGLLAIQAATNQACASISPTDEQKLSSVFLYYYFQYQYENLRQLGHGANQRNMNAALIRSFPISFPGPDEQTEIVNALESWDVKIDLHDRKRGQLEDIFRTLLHELMTAKLRVHDLEISA